MQRRPRGTAASRAGTSGSRPRRSPGAGFGVEKALLVLPDPLPLRLDCRWVVPVHRRPTVAGDKKASRSRGRGKLPRRGPRSLPALCKQVLHSPSSLAGGSVDSHGCPRALSRLCGGRRRRARRRRPTGVGARGGVRDAARRLLRADAARPGAGLPRGGAGCGQRSTGSKAFPNVALLRSARRGRHRRRRLHARRARARAARRASPASGSSCTETTSPTRSSRRAAAAERLARRARLGRRGRTRARLRALRDVLVRVTPGIEADTHDAIKTGHRGSKFGLPPEQALPLIARAAKLGLSVAGLHVHLGSQLLDVSPARFSVDWLAAFAAECRIGARLDAGGRRPRRRPRHSLCRDGRRRRRSATSPGRSSSGSSARGRCTICRSRSSSSSPAARWSASAGVTLYRVGVVKQSRETVTYVAVDGGMSDNPRPQLYGARYTCLLANRADEARERRVTRCAASTASRATC